MIQTKQHHDYASIIQQVYKDTRRIKGGKNAAYIPQLAKVDPKKFGISICTVQGDLYHAGDYDFEVAIESISKLFSLAMAVKKHGTQKVFDKIGMEGSFMPFNSIVAAKLAPTHTINPFLNQGAMATTSLLYEKNHGKYKKKLVENMSDFADRKLKVGPKVYESESQTNSTNMALAYLLHANKRFYAPVIPSVDAYTYQCSVKVSSKDLATMAAVFANGGIHPISKKTMLTHKQTTYVINNLLPEGLYEYSDEWIMKTHAAAPAKSGVGGGILIIIPNVCGIGIVSPPLDKVGNSVKGIAAGVKLVNRIVPREFSSIISKTINKRKQRKRTSKKTRKRRQ